MKIRNGFVSNSSSSSFIILLNDLTEHSIEKILNHIEIAKNIDKQLINDNKPLKYEYYEKWDIKIDDFSLWASTTMDNFNLKIFLTDEVGITEDKIIDIGDGYFYNLYEDDDYTKLKNKMRNKKIIKLINKK